MSSTVSHSRFSAKLLSTRFLVPQGRTTVVSLSGAELHADLATYHEQALQLFADSIDAKKRGVDLPRRIVPVLAKEEVSQLTAKDLYKAIQEINKGLPEELREPLDSFAKYRKADLVELHSKFLQVEAKAREHEILMDKNNEPDSDGEDDNADQ